MSVLLIKQEETVNQLTKRSNRCRRVLLAGWVCLSLFIIHSPYSWAEDSKKEENKSTSDDKKKKPLLPTIPSKESKEKKPSVWSKMVKSMGKIVPKGVKKSWKKTTKKWQQTVEVYKAMRKLLKEGDDERKDRLKKEKKRLSKQQWQDRDHIIEKRILQQYQLELWQRSCHAGSATACISWAQKRPKEIKPWRLLRNIWVRRKQWERIMPICERLTQMKQAQLEDYLCYARSLVALNRAKKALVIFQALHKNYPTHGDIQLALGQAHLTQKEFKQAQTACLQATKSMPKDPITWNCLGASLRTSDKMKALRAYYKACTLGHGASCSTVLSLRPSGFRGLVWWSTTVARISAMGISKTTLSQSCYLGLASSCSQLAIQHRARAKRLASYKRVEQAEWWYRRATQIAPKEAINWRALGVFLSARKKWKQACPALQRSLQLDAKQPVIWRKLGECHKALAKQIISQSTQAHRKACALGQHLSCRAIKFYKQ